LKWGEKRMLENPSNLILTRLSQPAGENSTQLENLLTAYRIALTQHDSIRSRMAYGRDLNVCCWELSEHLGFTVQHVVLNLPWLMDRQRALWYRDRLREAVSNRGKILADATINRRLAVMSAVMQEFIRAGLISSNPFEGLTLTRGRSDPTPALSNDQRQALVIAPDVENARTPFERRRCLRDRILLALLFVHGIRREEARLVRFGDVTMNQGYQVLTVRQKGGKMISHRLHPKVWHYMQIYRAEFLEKDDDFLFGGLTRNGISKNDQPMSPQSINYVVHFWARKAQIKGVRVTPHCGRSTVITEALKKAPLQVVSRGIGHATIETTARYDRSRTRLDQSPMSFQNVEL